MIASRDRRVSTGGYRSIFVYLFPALGVLTPATLADGGARDTVDPGHPDLTLLRVTARRPATAVVQEHVRRNVG